MSGGVPPSSPGIVPPPSVPGIGPPPSTPGMGPPASTVIIGQVLSPEKHALKVELMSMKHAYPRGHEQSSVHAREQ